MSDEPIIDPRYAAAQLAQSLRAADAHADPALREKAETRARGWMAVLENLAKGLLKIGQRRPFADVPVWVTPIVLRGGFATGEHAAAGPLLDHERALAGPAPEAEVRLAANGSCLTPAGLAQLAARLEDRTYRVSVPEEGALLAVRWLIDQGEHASAAALIETISPFFDRLRFHPRPSEPQPVPTPGLETPVLLASAPTVATSLRRKTPSASVEAMREANEVWAPMTDAFVSLVLETLDAAPTVDGAKVVLGIPFVRTPEGFEARRATLLADYARKRTQHRLCTRPHRRNEVLGTIVHALSQPIEARGWESSRVSHRLAGFITAYGVPGSERHVRLRTAQLVGPSHAALAKLVADRIEAEGSEDAIRDRAAITQGMPLPERLREQVDRAIEAPLPVLLSRGAVKSAETLATLLPQLTGPALAERFEDPRARTLYAATYRAFRQRRGLLLLWLQHQVRFGELPWIAALESASDRDPAPAVRRALRELALLAIASFPATPIPNKLVSELSALAKHAALGADELPLVEEVASDIFMGAFSSKFLRAAKIAARMLGEGSLYARYYGLPYERVLRFERLEEKWSVKTSPEFDALCLELAALPSGGNPRARSGAMIEQASILTTHGLASLISVLDLEEELRPRHVELARVALRAALDGLERRVLPERVPRIQRMRAAKTLAFSWRQMLFFLSRAEEPDMAAFVAEARETLAARSPLARERFAPVLRGLEIVASGGRLERGHTDAVRLYGWSVERPFLMGPAAEAAAVRERS